MPGLLAVAAPYVAEALVPRVGARAMGWYVTALVAGGLVGRVGVALLSGLVGWRVAIGLLAALPLAAAVGMRGSLLEAGRPARSGSLLRSLANRRLFGVAVAGGALFFTFVGTFTYVTYRLEAPPYDYGTSTSSLVFLLWIAGAIGPLAGRVAERLGWRRLAAAMVALAAAGVGLTFFSWLPLIVIGLACVATAMFTGYTATQLGVSDVARADRGAASALYFSTYYGAGALGAYVPGLAWESHGWPGVAWLGLATLVARRSGARAGRPGGKAPRPAAAYDAAVKRAEADSDSVLARIVSTVASTLELDEVLRAVVRLLSEASAVHACFVYLVDDDGERLVLRGSRRAVRAPRRRDRARAGRGARLVGGRAARAGLHPGEPARRPAYQVRAGARGGALPVARSASRSRRATAT